MNKNLHHQLYHYDSYGDAPYTVSVASGKGGVGKSFVSSSLAICFARMAYRVALIDLDLGSANVHTYLGAQAPKSGLTDYLKGRVGDFNQLLSPTGIRNLEIISGTNDSFDIANITEDSYKSILQGIKSLDVDVVVLDLGAGTNNSTLDFFSSADLSLMALTPEPTAIENAYRFMKSSFYRKLKTSEMGTGIEQLIDQAMDQKNNLGIKNPSDLLKYLSKSDEIGAHKFLKEMENFQLGIVLNQVRSGRDIDVGKGIASISKSYFGMPVRYLGHIAFDNAVWQSLRKKRPLLLDHPTSPINNQIFAIAKLILGPQTKKAVV